jgi:hypothetical protein
MRFRLEVHGAPDDEGRCALLGQFDTPADALAFVRDDPAGATYEITYCGTVIWPPFL